VVVGGVCVCLCGVCVCVLRMLCVRCLCVECVCFWSPSFYVKDECVEGTYVYDLCVCVCSV